MEKSATRSFSRKGTAVCSSPKKYSATVVFQGMVKMFSEHQFYRRPVNILSEKKQSIIDHWNYINFYLWIFTCVLLFRLFKGPNINWRDESGCTALHHAALNGHKYVILYIIIKVRNIFFNRLYLIFSKLITLKTFALFSSISDQLNIIFSSNQIRKYKPFL